MRKSFKKWIVKLFKEQRKITCIALAITIAFAAIATGVIYADDSVIYTRYFKTAQSWSPNDHGFINFGSFPKTLADGTTGLPTVDGDGKLPDGTKADGHIAVVGSNRYLYEVGKNGGHWYKFEPIKWQILEVDDDNDRIVVMSESVLEARSFDVQKGNATSFNGVSGYNTGDKTYSYPSIRLYLNSFDSTMPYDYKDSTGYAISWLKYQPLAGEGLSKLQYQSDSYDPTLLYHDIGFLEKAFTEEERKVLIPELNSFSRTYGDGPEEIANNASGRPDKVRLLSYYELYSNTDDKNATYQKYGFASSTSATGVNSNRLGFVTDYSKSNSTDSPSKDSTTGRYTQICWTRSRQSTSSAYYTRYDGYLSYADVLNKYGIRPVITLDKSCLNYLSGEGNIDDPYNFEAEYHYTPLIVNGKELTTYFGTDTNGQTHGYVEYGKYPQRYATENEIAALPEGSSTIFDKVVEIPSGTYKGEYLQETDKNSENHWYKIEPITWKIIDVKNRENKIVLMTDKAIDSYWWDGNGSSSNSQYYTWYNSSNSTTDTHYPYLRCFLNGYDYSGTSDITSNLKYTPADMNSTKYSKVPFYQKAFNDDEKEAIVAEFNKNIAFGYDGSRFPLVADKVRLLSLYETFGVWGESINFGAPGEATFEQSNRLLESTDYSFSKQTERSLSTDYVYVDENTNKKYLAWWTLSMHNGNKKPIYVSPDGSTNTSNLTSKDYKLGVRPVITISLDNLKCVNESAGGSNSSDAFKFKKQPTFIKGNEYTTYLRTGSDDECHGFINYGSFPQRFATESEIENLPSVENQSGTWKFTSGQKSGENANGAVITLNNEKYLFETDKNGAGHWYKFEPIKWRILRVDSNSQKALVISDAALESRMLDTSTSKDAKWDGYMSGGILTVPQLRLYLNNYDSTVAFGSTTTSTAATSKLIYTETNDPDFSNQGFLEKAFTDEERFAIATEKINNMSSSYDNSTEKYVDVNGVYDKVGILSTWEMYSVNESYTYNQELGFANETNTKDPNRLFYATDYSTSKNYGDAYDATVGDLTRKTLTGWSRSRYNATNGYYVTASGTVGSYQAVYYRYAIRPVMTLDLSTLNKASGNGTSSDPYSYSLIVNEEMDLTRYYQKKKTDKNHGYLYYGSYPQTQVEKPNGVPNSPLDGSVYESTDGYKYLYESSKWFRIEPIKWQILDYDEKTKLATLMTESVVDSVSFDTYGKTDVEFTGYTDSSKKAYPSIRLFLNSYDTSMSSYYWPSSYANYSYSSLKYTPWTKNNYFKDKGFLEKAFTGAERANIVEPESKGTKVLTSYYGPYNGLKDVDGHFDKVRLLTDTMLYKVSSSGSRNWQNWVEYGFSYSNTATGSHTNRLGYATDYSLLHYTGSTGTDADTGRKTQSWFTMNRTSAIKATAVGPAGKVEDVTFGSSSSVSYESSSGRLGIRPVITLDLSSLTSKSGTGTLDNPYTLGKGISVPKDANKPFTKYFETDYYGNNHGYVEYGSFPKDLADGTEGLPSIDENGLFEDGSKADGQVVEIESGRYLYEVGKNGGHWYKFEPIVWRILKDNEEDETLVLFSENVLEARYYTTEPNSSYGKWVSGTIATFSRSPISTLRTYLNNYDYEGSYGRWTTQGTIYSTAMYRPSYYDEFYNKGFLEKAFTTKERDNIVADVNSFYNGEDDSGSTASPRNAYGEPDKVRLLSSGDFSSSISSSNEYINGSNVKSDKYIQNGFDNVNNLVGYATDYSKSHYYSELSKNYVKPDGDSRDTMAYWYIKPRYLIDTTGSTTNGGDFSVAENHKGGVRPLITINYSNLEIKNKGAGNINEPYVFEWKDEEEEGISNSLFTNWLFTDFEGKNHGYINFGSYPKTEITSSSDYATWSYLSSLANDSNLANGETVVYNGEKYLREDKSTTKHYYKFEPIKWRVLKSNNKDRKLYLLADQIIDARYYDAAYNSSLTWDGLGGKALSTDKTKWSYPYIRLFLNSYDIKYDSGFNYSSLEYTEAPSGTAFHDIGFLEKAFSNAERDIILPDFNLYTSPAADGYKENFIDKNGDGDKVRLMSSYELFDHQSTYKDIPYSDYIGTKLGFYWQDAPDDLRTASCTDYAALTKKAESSTEYTLDGEKSATWWTLSRYCSVIFSQNYAVIENDGGMLNTYPSTYSYSDNWGVRPVISIDLSKIKYYDGTGDKKDPYNFYYQTGNVNINVSSNDTSFGTVSNSSGTYPMNTEVTVTATPNEGYTFDGWYQNNKLVSPKRTYTFKALKDMNLEGRFETISSDKFQTYADIIWDTNAMKPTNEYKVRCYYTLGEYPKTKVEDPASVGLIAPLFSIEKNKIYQGTDGNKYVYINGKNDNDGFYKFEPITWILYAKDGTDEEENPCWLLMTKDIIDTTVFFTGTNYSFGSSTPVEIRTFLNSTDTSSDNFRLQGFLGKAFSEQDRELIINHKVAKDGDYSSSKLTDKVSILRKAELDPAYGMFSESYSSSKNYAKDGAKATEFAKANSASDDVYYFTTGSTYPDLTKGIGIESYFGTYQADQARGLRPTIGIAPLSDSQIYGGDGTLENPYRLSGAEYQLSITTNDIIEPYVMNFVSGKNQKLTCNIIPGNTIKGIYTDSTKTTKLSSDANPDRFNMPEEDYQIFVDVNVTETGALNASNMEANVLTNMLKSSEYLNVINNSESGFNIVDVVLSYNEEKVTSIASYLGDLNEASPFESLSDVKDAIISQLTGYDIEVSSEDTNKGTVTPSGNVNSAIIHVEAKPNIGFIFDGWYDGNTLLSKSVTFDYCPDSDGEIKAKFNPVVNTTYAGDLVNHINAGVVSATINFGSFPKSDVTTEMSETLSTLTPNSKTGKIEYGGHEYVHEGDKYYLVEPITWRILKVEDDGEGNNKITAISENVLESRTWDSQDSKQIFWDGSIKNDEPNGSYPLLRLYLNNYDLSGGVTNYSVCDTTNDPLAKSNLLYADSPKGTAFYDRGFIEKAFSSDERGRLVGGNPENTYATSEGDNTLFVNDKVRLLSLVENYSLKTSTTAFNPAKFGINPYFAATGEESRRLGYSTDYAKGKYSPGQFTGDTVYGTFGSETMRYWLLMHNSSTGARVVDIDGSVTSENNIAVYRGVRPVISFMADDLSNINIEAKELTYYNFDHWNVDGAKDTTNTESVYGDSVDVETLKKITAVFVSESNITINSIDYTPWHIGGSDEVIKGFINLGYYPKTKITNDSLIETLEGVPRRFDNTVIYNGDKYYKFENEYLDDWFKFEPITWQILDIGSSTHKAKLLSEEVIESRIFDSQNQTKLLWNGTGGSENEYPILRLYLNNYKITNKEDIPSYSTISEDSLAAKSDLTYENAKIGTTFYDRGFLEKAFSKTARDTILSDAPLQWSPSEDGSSYSDKVRLLPNSELYVVSINNPVSLKYGFSSENFGLAPDNDFSKWRGKETGRLGYATDYAAINDYFDEYATDDYVGASEGSRTAHVWRTSSRSSEMKEFVVYPDGGIADIIGVMGEIGIRPSITVDLNAYKALIGDGDGSLDNPYSYESKLTIDTNELTGKDIKMQSPGDDKEVEIDIIPGNTIKGIYKDSSKANKLSEDLSPSKFTMPNTDYSIYVDVNVTEEGVLYVLNNLDKEVIEAMLRNDDYLELINTASGEDVSEISSYQDAKISSIAEAIIEERSKGPFESLSDVKALLEENLAPTIFTVNIDGVDVEFNTDDRIYKWDVSEVAGTNKIVAFYFRGVGAVSGNDYGDDGIVVLRDMKPSLDPENPNRLMHFDAYYWKDWTLEINGAIHNYVLLINQDKSRTLTGIDFYQDYTSYRNNNPLSTFEEPWNTKYVASPWSIMNTAGQLHDNEELLVKKFVVAGPVHSGQNIRFTFAGLDECEYMDLSDFIIDYDYIKEYGSNGCNQAFSCLKDCTIKMPKTTGYLAWAFKDFENTKPYSMKNITLDFTGCDIKLVNDYSLCFDSGSGPNCGDISINKIILPNTITGDDLKLEKYFGTNNTDDFYFEVFDEDGKSLGYTTQLLDINSTKFEGAKYIVRNWSLAIYVGYNAYVNAETPRDKRESIQYFMDGLEDPFGNITPHSIDDESFNGKFALREMIDHWTQYYLPGGDINLTTFLMDAYEYMSGKLDDKFNASGFVLTDDLSIDFDDSDNPYGAAYEALNEYVYKIFNEEVEIEDDEETYNYLDEVVVSIKDAVIELLNKGFKLFQTGKVLEDVTYTDFLETYHDYSHLDPLGNFNIDTSGSDAIFTCDINDSTEYTEYIEGYAAVWAFVDKNIKGQLKITLDNDPNEDFFLSIYVKKDAEEGEDTFTLTKDDFTNRVCILNLFSIYYDFDDSYEFTFLLQDKSNFSESGITNAEIEITLPKKVSKNGERIFEPGVNFDAFLFDNSEFEDSYQILKELDDYYVVRIGNQTIFTYTNSDKVTIYYGNTGFTSMIFTNTLVPDKTFDNHALTTITDYTQITNDNVDDLISSGEFKKAEINTFNYNPYIEKLACLMGATDTANNIVLVPKNNRYYAAKLDSSFTPVLKTVGNVVFGALYKAFDDNFEDGTAYSDSITVNPISFVRPTSGDDTISIKAIDGNKEYTDTLGLSVSDLDHEFDEIKLFRTNNKGNQIEISTDAYEVTYTGCDGVRGSKGKLTVTGDGVRVTGTRDYAVNLYEIDSDGNGIDDAFENKKILEKDGKEYWTGDAEYAIDISSDGSYGVVAYYFNGDNYDGEVVIYSANEEAMVTEFNSVMQKHSNKIEIEKLDLDSDYKKELSSLDISDFLGTSEIPTRGFMNYQDSGQTYNITPWSILETNDDFGNNTPVKKIIFANDVTLSSGDTFFASLDNITSLDLTNVSVNNAENANVSFASMFENCEKLESITFNDEMDTKEVTNMYKTFWGCYKLKNLDVSMFNTAKVTNFGGTFGYLTSEDLDEIDLTNFSSSSAINANQMFMACTNLESIKFGNEFTASSISNFDSMFNYCSSLSELDIRNFNTSSGKNFSSMFNNCSSLGTLTTGENFKMTGTWESELECMFMSCSSLKNLDLSGFDLAGIDEDWIIEMMLEGCTSLEYIKLPISVPVNGNIILPEDVEWYIFDASGSTNLETTDKLIPASGSASYVSTDVTIWTDENGINYGPQDLATYEFNYFTYKARWNISDDGTKNLWGNVFKVKTDEDTYKTPEEYILVITGDSTDSKTYTGVYLSDYNKYYTTYMQSSYSSYENYTPWTCDLYADAEKITKAVVAKGVNPKNYDYYFAGLYNLKEVEFEFNEEEEKTPENMQGMFLYSPNITAWEVPEGLDTSGVQNMSYMFLHCSCLKDLDLSKLNTSSATTLEMMFQDCGSLEELDLKNFETDEVLKMTSMFDGCINLNSLDISSFNTELVTDMSSMFMNCEKLTTLDLSGFNTASVQRFSNMFDGCKKLSDLDISSFDTTSAQDFSYNFNYMFHLCESLESLTLPSTFKANAVYEVSGMFEGCKGLKTLTFPESFTLAGASKVNKLFKDCSSLTSLDLSHFVFNSDQWNSGDVFTGCSSLEYIKLPVKVPSAADIELPAHTDTTKKWFAYTNDNVSDFTNQTKLLAKVTDGITFMSRDTLVGISEAMFLPFITKEYDGSTTSTKQIDVSIGDDTVKVNLLIEFSQKDVGEDLSVTITPSFNDPNDEDLGDLVPYSSDQGSITQKEVTFNVTLDPKEYDGTNVLDDSQIHISDVSEILASDAATVSVTGSYDSGAVSDTHVVTLSASLSGTDKDNYKIKDELQTITKTDGVISKKHLGYDLSITNKVYDGNEVMTANVTATPKVSDIVGSENVSITVTDAHFTDGFDFGTHNLYIKLELAGTHSGNYYIVDEPTGMAAKVTKSQIDVTFNVTGDKTYDGTTSANSIIEITSVDPAGIEVLFDAKFKNADGTYDKNVGDSKTIEITPIFKNASDAANFDFKQTTYTKTGNVKPAALSYTPVATNRTYNGEKTVTVNVEQGSLETVFAGDNPKVTLTGEMTTKDAGESKTVNVTAVCDDPNYKVENSTCTVKISKKALHIDASGEDIEYGAGDTVNVTFTARTTDILSGDTVDIASSQKQGTGTVSYTSAGNGLDVENITWPTTLTGADKENYEITPTSCKVNVKQLDLTGKGLEVTLTYNSDYDGRPKDIHASVKITSDGTILKEGRDFTISWDNNKDIGAHTATITFIGDYKGYITRPFEILGHLDPVTLSQGETENVYKGEYVHFVTKDDTCTLQISYDNKASWITMPSNAYQVNNDEDVFVKQSKAYYKDSSPAEFKFHVITAGDIAMKLAKEMNDSDSKNKKKQDIKNILDDDRNVDLLFDTTDVTPGGEASYNSKLKDDDTLNKVVDYLAASTARGSTDDEVKEDIKKKIKEAIDLKDFEDSINVTISYEEAMIKYEKLSEKLKEVFDEDVLADLKYNYYNILETKMHETKESALENDPIEVFGVLDHVDDSDPSTYEDGDSIMLVVERITELAKINYLQNLLNGKGTNEKIVVPYDIKLINKNETKLNKEIQPKPLDSILVKIKLPDTFYDKVVNVYGEKDGIITKLDVLKEKFENSCLIYFDAEHFSNYFLTGNQNEAVVTTKQIGDKTLGSINPEGSKILNLGSNFNLNISSRDKNVANKATVKVLRYDQTNKTFIADDSNSKVLNLNKTTSYSLRADTNYFIEVELGFDESFKEEPKKPDPAPSGGGGGGGGATITVGTLPIDEEGKVIAFHKAYMKGYEDNTFRPQNYVTREEVATIVARLHSEFNEDYNFTAFNDFDDASNRWSNNYIGFCKYKELIKGREDGLYYPKDNMTRAELATLVNNFMRVQNFEIPDEGLDTPAFSDVEGRWFEEAVNKLARMGILNGYEDGTFKGDQYVTRVEVSIVMNKINGRTITKDIPSEYIEKVTSAFKDITSNRWFFKDVAESSVDHPANLY